MGAELWGGVVFMARVKEARLAVRYIRWKRDVYEIGFRRNWAMNPKKTDACGGLSQQVQLGAADRIGQRFMMVKWNVVARATVA